MSVSRYVFWVVLLKSEAPSVSGLSPITAPQDVGPLASNSLNTELWDGSLALAEELSISHQHLSCQLSCAIIVKLTGN